MDKPLVIHGVNIYIYIYIYTINVSRILIPYLMYVYFTYAITRTRDQ